MAFEQFLGLGIGEPQYHDSLHLKKYDTDKVRSANGGMSVITSMLDEIMYTSPEAPEETVTKTTGEQVVQNYFEQTYDRPGDPEIRGDYGDTLRIKVSHTRYLGKSALQQEYSVIIETEIEHKNTPAYHLATKYFIEQTNHPIYPYYATILRPDILTARNVDDDVMTRYDGRDMYRTLEMIQQLAPQLEDSSQDAF